ncbi:peptidase M23-like protein [Prauserella shujinwangii]|uniref:Peptidase M23-like protein n=1 Tax=Prauserella shujinwangii TaxID=1453103 RepID=A0A2T0M3D1_9PSEU|nr:M23 family metallopeptidase [Prauserella shujinwangii]PRX51236.1 peptidase M23-like protein [Prauserella shujinwangii]
MKRIAGELQRQSTRIVLAGVALVIVTRVAAVRWPDVLLLDVATPAGIVLVLLGLAAQFAPGLDAPGPPRTVHPPVTGRWRALNSPASKVPSHGVRAYGQAYAVDLVYEPDDRERPAFGAGPGMRPPEDYPAFGQPVLSMVSGTVVRVRDGARDHRSRTAWWSLLYLLFEGMVREIGGAGRVVGNHVVVAAEDGTFALVAHLRRGSAEVREGDTVHAGQRIGQCGNSGNSSEPHVHAQLMDRASPAAARGLPLRFTGIRIGDGPVTDGMPANNEHLSVS